MIKPSFSQKSACGLKYILDRTEPCSAPGKNALKKIEFYTPDAKEELLTELENVEKLKQAVALRAKEISQLESVFFHLKDLHNTFDRLSRATLDEVELFELKAFLRLTRQASGIAETLSEKYGLKAVAFRKTEKAFELLEADKGEGFFVDDALSEKLLAARREKETANAALARAKNEAELAAARQRHLNAAAKEDAAQEEARERLSALLRPFAEDFAFNSELAGRLDLMLAKARLAYASDAIKPIVGGDELKLIQMTNPEIEEKLRLRDSDFTPVSIEANRGVTLITGANMGGKSVALKTIALNVLLAQLGYFVYAREARVPLFDFVEIVNENMQSVDRGLSTFGGEIVKLNSVMERLKKGMFGLCLMDEFAGGTNFEEGSRIFRAVERALNEMNGIFILTTHFDGVSADAKALYQVKGLSGADLKSLDREIESGADGTELIAQYMDYGLVRVDDKTKGVPKDAVAVCRLLRIDQDVLKYF
ncbi:MAG: hypothetical protein HPY94_03620 [Clostridia bacterium]|nr:hypothetical protein [Clostridia bacterium]